MLRKHIGSTLEKVLTPPARWLYAHGIGPNELTFGGLSLNLVAALFYAGGNIIVGGIVVMIASVGDMLDGQVARTANITSKFGAFTDSVVDRYSDCIIFGGILVYYARQGSARGILAVFTIVCGSFLVSYVRARAELVIPRCDIGIMERPERLILLVAGSLFGFFEICLITLAVMTHVTAARRIYYTYKMSRNNTE